MQRWKITKQQQWGLREEGEWAMIMDKEGRKTRVGVQCTWKSWPHDMEEYAVLQECERGRCFYSPQKCSTLRESETVHEDKTHYKTIF